MPASPFAPASAGASRGRGRVAGVAVALLVASVTGACGKRGDPLPPFRRNPEPIQRLELAQRGEEYELAFVTPTRTIDGAQLPVLDVEVLVSSEVGVLDDLAEPIRLKAAPGERIVQTGPLPEPGTPLRFAVRTRADGKPSALSPESLLVVKAAPPPPSDVSVRATPEGLSLTWTECVPTTPDPPLPEDQTTTGEGDAVEPPGEGESGEPSGGAEGTAAPGAAARPPESPLAADEGPDVPPEGPQAAPPEGAERPPAAPPEKPPAASPAGTEKAQGGTPPESPGGAVAAAPPAPAPSPGVRLYRRTADGEYGEPLVASALANETYLDTAVEHGQELCYRLRTLLRGQPLVEGGDSAEVCATFLDVQPPAPPTGLSVLRLDDAVELAWSPLPDGAEIPAALHVYRSTGGGPLERIAALEGDATRWTDPDVPDDVVVEYALTATDGHDNESAPSQRARLIPR